MLAARRVVRSKTSFVRYFTPTAEHEALKDNLQKLIAKELNPRCEKWEAEKAFPAHEVFKLLGMKSA